ncbi:MAG: hypothetical protein ACNS62_08215 [Candidatus Cyclobacteriaceae bacterium M3_2C_046]
MTKTFTHDDIIRYVYQETSESENKEIEQLLLCDSELLDLYNQLINIKDSLNDIMKVPSDESVDNILHYSRSMNYHTVN